MMVGIVADHDQHGEHDDFDDTLGGDDDAGVDGDDDDGRWPPRQQMAPPSAHLLAQREPHYIQIAPFRGHGDDDHFPDNDYDDG